MSNSNKKRKVTSTSASDGADEPTEGATDESKTSAAKKTTASKSAAAKKPTAAKSTSAKSTAAKSTTAKAKAADSKPSGKGGAVNVGAKKNTGPKTTGRKTSSSSKAVADARKAATKGNNQVVLWILAAVVVVALAVAGVIAVTNRSDEANALPGGFPEGQVVEGTLVYGDEAAPAKVDYWVDLLCPFCRMFEQDAAETIEKAVADGDAQLQVHMVGLLDQSSKPAGYSSRAAAAVMCAAPEGKSYQLMKKLYEEQPAEGGPGLTDDELAEFANEVGAPDSVAECIAGDTNEDLIAANSEQFMTNGYEGTPTVLVNDQELQGGADALEDAINAVQG